MPLDPEKMTTEQLLTLAANALVRAKSKMVEEYAGTGIPEKLDPLIDEIAGGVAQALEEIKSGEASATEPENVGPTSPAMPAPAEG